MKATGIVRRIDDLGRVVIPKEIRRTMRIREGDPLEIYTDKDGGVIFRKYSLMGALADFAGQLCETLNRTCGRVTVICDREPGEPALPLCAGQDRPALSTAAPILSGGDVLGCVTFVAQDQDLDGTEVEYKLAQSIAAFLGRHMEN